MPLRGVRIGEWDSAEDLNGMTPIFVELGLGTNPETACSMRAHNTDGFEWFRSYRSTALRAGYMQSRCSPS